MKQFVSLGALVIVMSCTGHSAESVARAAADSVHADSIARARQDSVNRAQPGYVIDSIFPPEEEIRRFRAALTGSPARAFAGGSLSREALVRRFVKDVANSDSTDLRKMALSVREFADLYYPDSPYSHPPYHQSPDLAWRLIQDPSTAGLNKLLRKLGGKPMTYVSDNCDPKVLHEGETTRYAGCLVRVVQGVDTTARRYYGSIVERGGQFKFLSYTNDF